MQVITLIFTIYDYKISEIENINYIWGKLDNKLINLIVASDNPDINKLLDSSLHNDIKCVPSLKNVGKFMLVKNVVESFVKTPFFKVVDPDDIILVDPLIKVATKIKKINRNFIIKMNPALEYKGELLNLDSKMINESDSVVFEKNYRDKFSMVNWGVILPTSNLIRNKIIAYNQTKSSDILMSLSDSYISPKNIVEISDNFYLYNYKKGLTKSRYNENLFNQMINFLDILDENNEINFTTSPNFYDFQWSVEFLSRSNLNTDVILSYLKDILTILNRIGKDKWSKETVWDKKLVKKIKKALKGKEIKWR